MELLKERLGRPSDALDSVDIRLAKEQARALGLGFVCAYDGDHPDERLFLVPDLPLYHRYHYIPFRKVEGKTVLVVSICDRNFKTFSTQHYGENIEIVIASERDIRQWLAKRAALCHVRSARLALRRKFKHLCADRTLLRSQFFPLVMPFIAIGVALWASPLDAGILILSLACVFYGATLLFKLLIFQQWQHLRKKPIPEPLLPKDENLPIYTLLVPVFKEPKSVLEHLLQAMKALDYPADKKDVLFICEESDPDTVHALKALHPPSFCRIIVVPDSKPKTKPKALNVAMHFAKGEYAVIFDAEDRPEPQQLKKAAARFAADATLSCLQAPLNYDNRNENLLTQLFAIEYGTLFRMQLPALEALELPIPLGGTSNHIRMDVLKKAAGWDAFNVTEDADLGVRLSYLGEKIGMLDSITMEEAPITVRSWLYQRSRWIKGYMQTWLVYMRDPKMLKEKIGAKAYYGFQFFIGAPALTFMLAPFFWVLFLMGQMGAVTLSIPIWLNSVCVACLLFGIYSHWLYAKACLLLHQWPGMKLAVSLYPFYWFLHIIASFMALYDLVVQPHQWRKTTHGVTKVARGAFLSS